MCRLLTTVTLTAALLAAGCGDKNPATKDAEATLREADQAQDEAAKAVRVEYIREAGERLTAFDAKLKGIADRAATATGQAKTDLEKKYADTKGKREAAAARLRELKEATGSRWEQVKDATGSAFDELKRAFD